MQYMHFCPRIGSRMTIFSSWRASRRLRRLSSERPSISHIYINGRFLTQNRSGTQRFAEEIILALDESLAEAPAEGYEITILHPAKKKRSLKLRNIKQRAIGNRMGHLWEQIDLYSASRNGLLLNFINSGPLMHKASVVTFHDASIFERPELFSLKYRIFHKLLRPLLARRALKLITVSKFSRERLARSFKVSEGNFSIVPNGCDHISNIPPDTSILKKHDLKVGEYVLCVGNASPNKNISAAVRAFNAAALEGYEFVSVGMPDGRVFGSLPNESRKIKRLRGISDNALRALFENATLFAFPSKYEGFGIPLLEAMRLGCPVITSKAGANPETVAGAAIQIDPENVGEFSAQMRIVAFDKVHRAKMIEDGYARASNFEWRSSAEKLRSIIETLLPRSQYGQ